MEVEILGIPGPVVFRPKTHIDNRGSFKEIYHKDRYADYLPIGIQWEQMNHSTSGFGTIHGLHFRHNEAKLITVVNGSINDVVVDVRKDSNTLGHWISIKLHTGYQLFVPDGFAHGFEVTSTEASVVHLTTKMYDPVESKGIIWNDPDLNIHWEIKKPILSDRDTKNQTFAEYNLVTSW